MPIPETRPALVEALFALFRRRGYEGVSIGDISAATGLGRSSLYHHFPGGKDDMAHAVVAYARTAIGRELLAPLATPGPISVRVDAMIDGAARLYGDGPCVLAGLAADGVDGPLAAALAAIFRDWAAVIARALVETSELAPAEADSRANAALALIQGGLVMARATGEAWRFPSALAAARSALLA
jgi:AcrR family transcriptional regulator